MKRLIGLRIFLASLLSGAMLLGGSCQPYRDLIWPSIRDGMFSYVSGSVSSSLDSTMLSDYILNNIIGQYTGGAALTQTGI